MLPSQTCNNVTVDQIQSAVAGYSEHVPPKLKDLEELRLQSVPHALQERKKDGTPFLEKDELLKLVEWKLKHGTFRPNLMKLVSSNSDKSIRDTTTEAFAKYKAESIVDALPTLTKLSGIGPATASLILSVYDPIHAPFFSDELFRYLKLETTNGSQVRGWDRKIGYTKKEYSELCAQVQRIRKRLHEEVTALDLEKLAYVLAPCNEKPSALKRKEGGPDTSPNEASAEKNEPLQDRQQDFRKRRKI